jgi:hypothetical protein
MLSSSRSVLTFLNLNGNFIANTGCTAIAQGLLENPCLEQLSLDRNQITNSGAL